MSLKPKVRILTSSHKANDERIFYKQAKSITGAGYDTAVIAPHPHNEVLDGIAVKAVPKFDGKLARLIITPLYILISSIREKADLYHFHDPELIPVGVILKLLGKKVVYDAHEYYKLKIMSKAGIPRIIRQLTASAFDIFETAASITFNAVIVVDKTTEAKFRGRSVRLGNFPFRPQEPVRRRNGTGVFKCVYAGGLSADRGLFKMLHAMEYVDDRIKLVLAGPMSDADIEEMKRLKGYERVEYLGFIPWLKVLELLPECDLGLVLLQPVPAYIYAGENTVKLFEYMMACLPTLASDFPNLKEILDHNTCGITVDPTNPAMIAEKIMYFADNPDVAGRMGENGVKAVMARYNWENEEKKLLALYSRILDSKARGMRYHA